MAEPLLEVSGLSVELASERGPLRVLDGVDLALHPNQTLGLWARAARARRSPRSRC